MQTSTLDYQIATENEAALTETGLIGQLENTRSPYLDATRMNSFDGLIAGTDTRGLNDRLRHSLGALLIAFAGFTAPIVYVDPIAEFRRSGASSFFCLVRLR